MPAGVVEVPAVTGPSRSRRSIRSPPGTIGYTETIVCAGFPSTSVADRLTARVRALVAAAPADRRVLVGIAGAPGVGKSTLAVALAGALAQSGVAAAHVPMDGFHLADAGLSQLGLLERKGAPETFDPAGYAALLARIAAGEEVWAPAFERELEQPLAQAIRVPSSTRVVVSEGNYLLLGTPPWRTVRQRFDEVWFCRIDDDLRRERLIARHVRFGKTPTEARRWVMRLDEANARRVAATEPAADLVVDLR